MIINKLKINLNRYTVAPTIDAVQGDICSRILEINLHSAGKPLLLPENMAVLIRYKKADGKGGEYDTLPDGNSAWPCRGNILRLTLAPQVLTYPGNVFMTVTLIAQGKQQSTFPLQILVQPSAQPLIADSENYFKITSFLAAPDNVKAGQYLQFTSVDKFSRVTGIAAANAASSGGGSGAPVDWEAGTAVPSHILNRPFYSEYLIATLLESVILTATEETDNAAILPDVLDLYDGITCTVTYNGTAHSYSAREITEDGMTYCFWGNASPIDSDNTGELQATISALYKGSEHSIMITDRVTEEYEGTVYHTVEFLVSHESSYSNTTSLPVISRCVWNSFGVNVLNESTLVKPFSIEESSVACVLVKLPNDTDPNWRKITDTLFEGIVQKNTSSNSALKFLLSVDDTGTLSVTPVTL